jgi:hypothetical protein
MILHEECTIVQGTRASGISRPLAVGAYRLL